MKEKSLLSILKEEQKIVDEIGFKKSDMLGLLEDSEKNGTETSRFLRSSMRKLLMKFLGWKNSLFL